MFDRRTKTIDETTGWDMLKATGGGLVYGLFCFVLGASLLRGLFWLVTGS